MVSTETALIIGSGVITTFVGYFIKRTLNDIKEDIQSLNEKVGIQNGRVYTLEERSHNQGRAIDELKDSSIGYQAKEKKSPRRRR